MRSGFGRSSNPESAITSLGSVDPALNGDIPCSPSDSSDSSSLSHPNAALVVVFFAIKYGFVGAFEVASERSSGVEGKDSSAGGDTGFCPVSCEELTGLRVIDEGLKGFGWLQVSGMLTF